MSRHVESLTAGGIEGAICVCNDDFSDGGESCVWDHWNSKSQTGEEWYVADSKGWLTRTVDLCRVHDLPSWVLA